MSPMQLSINISDRTAVAAAIPLLQLILGHTFAVGDTGTITTNPEAPANPAVFASTPAVLPPGAETPVNPAAFTPLGAFPLAQGAPSTAGAIPPMSAPVGQQVFSPPNPGMLPPALPTGQLAFAPTMSAPPAGIPGTAPVTGVELDAEGLPWDERINAGTKTKTEKGVWKAKKGINDPALVARVKAESAQRVQGGAGGMAPAQQSAAVGAMPPLGAGPFVPPAASFQPVQPAAPSVPAGPPQTFEQFMPRITAACASNVLPMESVQAAVAAYQLPSITSLQQNPTYVPHVWQYLQQQYPALV